MEQKNFKALLRRTLVIPVIALAILAAVLLGEVQSLKSSMQWVDHTDQVISAGQELIKLIIDMETGARGYQDTGVDEYLQPYNEANPIIESKFDALNQLVSDNPAQQAQLAAMRSRFEQWRLLIDQRIEQRRSHGRNDNVNLRGKQLMDSVRAAQEAFIATEERLRSERVRKAGDTSRLVTITGILLSLGIAVFLATFSRGQLRSLASQFRESVDVAEQRAEALRQSEERWATTLQSIGDAVMSTDASGNITFMNPLAKSLTGCELEQAKGRPIEEVFRVVNEDSDQPLENPATRVLRINRVVELANRAVLIGRLGTRTPVADTAAPIRDVAGNLTGVVLVFRDVTERRARESERAEALLREQVQRKIAEDTASRLRKIESVTEAALTHLPLEKMLQQLLYRTAEALQADIAVILLLNEETQTLEVRAALGLEEELKERIHVPLGTGIAGTIASTGQLRIIENLAEEKVYQPYLRERSASLMGAPLVVEDRVIGVMHVDSKTPRKFTDAEAALLRVVADRVALTIDRKQAEEELARLASFPTLNPYPIAELDSAGRVCFLNPAAQKLLPDLEEKQLEHPWLADWESVVNAIGQEETKVHFRDVSIGGTEYLQTIHQVPGTKHIRIYGLDITGRRRAEEALREQAELLDVAHDAIMVRDLDGTIRFWNHGAERMYGYSRQQATDRISHDLLRTVFPQPLAEIKADLLREGRWEGELTHTTQDGTLIVVASRWVLQRDKNGQAYGVMEINNDITNRKRAEDALRQSEERWSITLQSIGDAVISTCAEGKIVFMNDVAQKLTGWPLAEAAGQDLNTVFNIIQEVTRIRPENPVAKVMRMGQVVGLANHTALITRDGTELPIEDSGAPIRNKEGQVTGVVLVFHDTSEKRRAEKAVRDSERLATTGRLASTLAHEIHNPLDAVGNLLFLIDHDAAVSETARQYVAMASEEVARITQMTRHMLTFQREAKAPVPLKIGEVLDNVIALHERKIESAVIQVEKEVEFEGEFLGLPGEMRQVFANLIGNAIEAIGKDGKIRLHAYAGTDWRLGRRGLRVTVADNGPGIPANIRARIFEPFFTTKGESGTGLGLWITLGVVEKNEGTLRLRTVTRDGRSGTCFSVFLPFIS